MENNITLREQHYLLEMKNKALQIPKMELKEVVGELGRIRKEYEVGHISMDVANTVGKPFVNKYNVEAQKRAQKYGLKTNVKMRQNVKFYPNNVYQ